jgi:WD40 repeat protein
MADTARVWNVVTGGQFVALENGSPIFSASFSLDGNRIVTASLDRTARVWDAATGRDIAVLKGHELALVSAAFSPDGTRVVTASYDKTARIWDAATGAKSPR